MPDNNILGDEVLTLISENIRKSSFGLEGVSSYITESEDEIIGGDILDALDSDMELDIFLSDDQSAETFDDLELKSEISQEYKSVNKLRLDAAAEDFKRTLDQQIEELLKDSEVKELVVDSPSQQCTTFDKSDIPPAIPEPPSINIHTETSTIINESENDFDIDNVTLEDILRDESILADENVTDIEHTILSRTAVRDAVNSVMIDGDFSDEDYDILYDIIEARRQNLNPDITIDAFPAKAKEYFYDIVKVFEVGNDDTQEFFNSILEQIVQNAYMLTQQEVFAKELDDAFGELKESSDYSEIYNGGAVEILRKKYDEAVDEKEKERWAERIRVAEQVSEDYNAATDYLWMVEKYGSKPRLIELEKFGNKCNSFMFKWTNTGRMVVDPGSLLTVLHRHCDNSIDISVKKWFLLLFMKSAATRTLENPTDQIYMTTFSTSIRDLDFDKSRNSDKYSKTIMDLNVALQHIFNRNRGFFEKIKDREDINTIFQK